MTKHKPAGKYRYREPNPAKILYPDMDNSPDIKPFQEVPEVDADKPLGSQSRGI